MEKRIIITVDGLAGSGKTSLSKELAKKLKYVHFSSGILYRVIGFLINLKSIKFDDERAINDILNSTKIELNLSPEDKTLVYIDGKKYETSSLYTPECSEAASKCGELLSVRKKLLNLQRDVYPGKNIVAEGRDLGTVIYPEAKVKFFIEASEETRVLRRYNQQNQTSFMSKKELERALEAQPKKLENFKKDLEIELLERDRRDTERGNSPTIAAKDAIIIKNEGQTLTQVVENMYDLALQRVS